jgi:DNA invertase Pin-like site-specific DNA recombinase
VSFEKDYNEKDAETGLFSAIDRLAVLAAKGVGLLIRVSSARQRKRSKGSQKYQQDQVRFLEGYRASTDSIRVFDARGESAKPGAHRPVFKELVAAVRRREIYVVLVSDADRISRNDPDAETLYNALQEIGGLVVVNGEIHDPANSNHRFLLRLRSLIAQYENEQRAFRSLTSKSAKARDLALFVKLPTGLVWASPEDQAFVERMREAGLGDRITEEALALHRTQVRRDGRRYFVFPYPDREINHACTLAVAWLREEGSLTGLLKRIQSDPEWPRPGQFPAVGGWHFNPEAEVAWKPLVGCDDGRDERGRGALYDWFRSPAVYGTYEANFPMLRKLSRLADSLGSAVRVEGAFPSFAAPDDQTRTAALLKNPDRPRIRGTWAGPRNHALSHLFCSHPMPLDSTCRRKLNAMYNAGRPGIYRYLAVACGIRGHLFSLPPQVDDQVLDIVCSAFTPERLKIELDRIQRHDGAEAAQIRMLEEQISELESRARWHDHHAFRAHQQGNTEAVEFHEMQHTRVLAEMGRQRRELEQVRARSALDEAISEKEYEEILSLASDLPELLRRARPIEGKVREILRELIRRVHARRLGSQAYHIEVEFHSGPRVGRTVVARPIRAPQPIQVLAHDRLRPWLEPCARSTAEQEEAAVAAAQALAGELNAALGARARPAWTADRVFTAALMYRHGESDIRTGAWSTPRDLAARSGLPVEGVAAAALLGRLGPARVHGGDLVLCPTREELHRTFPSFARRETARDAGWPAEDLVSLERLQRETGWDRYRIARVAERGSGVVTDAAGRRYTRRSLFRIPCEGELERLLEAAIPAEADRVAGRWITWTRARQRLPGVNINTYESHTAVVRPGYGENGLATVYIWIDPQVEARVRKPTLEDVIAELELEGISAEDFVLRREVLAQLRARFSVPFDAIWRRAVEAGHVLEVRAQGPESRRLSTYALVPAQVMITEEITSVKAFLAGEWMPPGRALTTDVPGTRVDFSPSTAPVAVRRRPADALCEP